MPAMHHSKNCWAFHSFSTASCSFTIESMVCAWNICLGVAAKWRRVPANGCNGSECRSPIKLGSRKGSSGWIFTADLRSWCCHQLGEFSAGSWCFGWKSRVSSNKSIGYWSVFHQFWTIVYLTTFLILDLLSQNMHPSHPGMACTNCASKDCMFWSCDDLRPCHFQTCHELQP